MENFFCTFGKIGVSILGFFEHPIKWGFSKTF